MIRIKVWTVSGQEEQNLLQKNQMTYDAVQ